MQRENQNHEKRDLPKRRSLRIGQILPRKSGSVRHSQFLVTRAVHPVPTVGRFPDFRVIATPRLLAFAMAQCGVTLRFTVTRSYRFFTCFPFTPCSANPQSSGTNHLRIQFTHIVTATSGKCNRIFPLEAVISRNPSAACPGLLPRQGAPASAGCRGRFHSPR